MCKKIVYIISSVFALVVLFFAICLLNKGLGSKQNGKVYITLIDIDQNVLLTETIEFKEGDSLPSLLDEKFDNFDFSDGYVKAIGSLSEYSNEVGLYYISLYVNDQYSELGISMIELENEMKITFKMEEYLWAK